MCLEGNEIGFYDRVGPDLLADPGRYENFGDHHRDEALAWLRYVRRALALRPWSKFSMGLRER